MFREMRRKKQQLTATAAQAVLYEGTSGVLAVAGEDGYPYAVPLSYVYDGQKIYFHSAKSGHKLDAIASQPKASFCVIGQDQVVPQAYTSYFKSVIVFGTVRVVEDPAAKMEAIQKLARKYAPAAGEQSHADAIAREWPAFCILELTPEHISGKQARELTGPTAPVSGV